MTKIYVINLERSSDRREQISAQLNSLDVEFEIFKAIDGKISPQHPLFEKYNEKRSIARRGKGLNAGQLGCYASHFLLWQECIKTNQNCFIIEDDAVLDRENFLTLYNRISQVPERIECIRLFKNKRKAFTSHPFYNIESISIHKFNKGHMSTTGYWITPNAARKFIACSQDWYLPVDIFMDRFWDNKVDCFGTVPACLDNDTSFDSNIDSKTIKHKRPLKVRILREVFQFGDYISRIKHNLLFKYSL